MLQLIQRASAKCNFPKNFRCSANEAVLLPRLWNTLYIGVLKREVSWFCFSYFNLPLLTESACEKVDFCWNFRCSAKKAVLLFRLWSILYIAVFKRKVSWFYFSYFNLALLTKSAFVKVSFSWIFRCSTKEAVSLPLSLSTLYVSNFKIYRVLLLVLLF